MVIWETVRAHFYGSRRTNQSFTGLAMEAVKRRVNRTRSEAVGGSVYGHIEVPPWSQVQSDDGTPSDTNFLLFHYSWFDKSANVFLDAPTLSCLTC
ncbi:hypothetical protein JG688_00017912 [Phytophthora aleatoria]|uniref:Uncharacterized protein n=1 Tax=Phytophthora aleatoria TaxID=2496075 RepID=A0A8J5IGP6_9STRA|nr:hypothetical protein JG688_00017912 [Phytophthora aleatoria]